MNCTQKVWSLVRKIVEAPLTMSKAVKIAKNVEFLQGKLNAGFRVWAEKGQITIDQIFEGEILKSFKQLQDEFGLCSTDFYKYLQLRNECHTENRIYLSDRPLS